MLSKSGNGSIKPLDIYTRLYISSDQWHGKASIHEQAVLIDNIPSSALGRHSQSTKLYFQRAILKTIVRELESLPDVIQGRHSVVGRSELNGQ